jgi:hypothetical protein
MESGESVVRGKAGQGVWRLPLLVAVACVVVLALSGLAKAAQFSGTITDHWTGAPIGGVRLTVDQVNANETEGTPVARPETDPSGRWEAQVPTGNYWVYAEAPGYYHLSLGAPIGNGGSQRFEVGEAGLNLASQMVPNDTPFISLYPARMHWSHVPKQGFRSMALEMSYESFVLIPSNWSESPIVTEIVDGKGRPVWPEELTKEEMARPGEARGAGNEFNVGSAEGCQFFSSVPYEQRPNVQTLKVVSYLRSDPVLRVEEPITPDFTGCSQTRLEIWNPQISSPGEVFLSATILDRLPTEQKVPGVMRYVVNGHKPIYVRVKNAIDPESTTKGSKYIHRGRNKVVVSFMPSVDTVTAPPPSHLIFKVPAFYYRHRR